MFPVGRGMQRMACGGCGVAENAWVGSGKLKRQKPWVKFSKVKDATRVPQTPPGRHAAPPQGPAQGFCVL